jgi:hypothetical protein
MSEPWSRLKLQLSELQYVIARHLADPQHTDRRHRLNLSQFRTLQFEQLHSQHNANVHMSRKVVAMLSGWSYREHV